MNENMFLSQVFWTKRNIRKDNVLNMIVNKILNSKIFEANLFYDDISEKYKKIEELRSEDIENILSNMNVCYINILKKDKREVSFEFFISDVGKYYVITFNINYKHYNNSIEEFINIGKELFVETEAFYGKIHVIEDTAITSRRFQLNKVTGAFWGNYFGKEYLEMIGKEKLIKSGCYSIQEVGNESLLIITSEKIENCMEKDARDGQKKLLKVVSKFLGEK